MLDIVSGLGEWVDDRPPDFSLFTDASRVSNLHARATIEILQRLRRRVAVVTPSQLLAEAIEALLVRPILAVRHRNKNARAIANVDALIEMARRYSVRLDEERQQAFERQRMWYVAVTRARDLLVVPHLPTSRQNSWFRAVKLDKIELSEVDLAGLPAQQAGAERVSANDQTAALFAQQSQFVSQSSPGLKWSQPSRHDPDRLPPLMDIRPLTELTEGRELPSGAGFLRGTLLHKLMEEIVEGDLRAEEVELRTRTMELLNQLMSQLPDVEIEAPNASELVATIKLTLTIPDLAALIPYLRAEVPIWQVGDKSLVAGRADALAIVRGAVVGVIDWKSDVAPSEDRKATYVAQVSDYLAATGATAGAIVFMTSGEINWVGDRQALLGQLSVA